MVISFQHIAYASLYLLPGLFLGACLLDPHDHSRRDPLDLVQVPLTYIRTIGEAEASLHRFIGDVYNAKQVHAAPIGS